MRYRSKCREMQRIIPLAFLLLLSSCNGDSGDKEIAAEYPAPDEAVVTGQLIDLTIKVVTERPSPPTLRFNQPRHVGCVRADFSVEPDLPADLRVGLFATPRTFPTWIRFANASDKPDTEKDFRGMSLKLLRVKGPKLLGAGDTHDFVLNSHPVLIAGTPKKFRDFVKNRKRFLSTNPKSVLIGLAGSRNHPSHLAIPYWSTTPYLFGEGKAVKYSARPCSQATVELPEPLTDGYLRDALREGLSGGGCFDFMVQFQTDAEQMPIEDATVEWDETASPFRKVARVLIPSQSFELPERMEFCQNLAFNPWRSYPEHRPLGGINRVRKEVYRELAEFRHQRNGVTYTEPTGDETF